MVKYRKRLARLWWWLEASFQTTIPHADFFPLLKLLRCFIIEREAICVWLVCGLIFHMLSFFSPSQGLLLREKNHKNVAANNNGNWMDWEKYRNTIKAALANNELVGVKKENVIARFLDTFCLYFFSFLLILARGFIFIGRKFSTTEMKSKQSVIQLSSD